MDPFKDRNKINMKHKRRKNFELNWFKQHCVAVKRMTCK